MNDVELFNSVDCLKQNIYCVVDFKSLTVLPPFLAQNDDEAIRNFTNLINYSNSILCRFPDDFKLYKLGEFITSFTGQNSLAKENLNKYLDNYKFIIDAPSCKQPDTNKFDDLLKRIEDSQVKVANANNVLTDQLGSLPEIKKDINTLKVKIDHLVTFNENLKEIIATDKKFKSKVTFINEMFKK